MRSSISDYIIAFAKFAIIRLDSGLLQLDKLNLTFDELIVIMIVFIHQKFLGCQNIIYIFSKSYFFFNQAHWALRNQFVFIVHRRGVFIDILEFSLFFFLILTARMQNNALFLNTMREPKCSLGIFLYFFIVHQNHFRLAIIV